MLYVLVFTLGVFGGIALTVNLYYEKLVGSLLVKSDPSSPNDLPYLFLELSKGVNAVRQMKYVMLEVKDENPLPRK